MNLPEILATPSYFVTKTHNYSKENKKEVIKWVQEVSSYSEVSGISKYDLFFWEHRCGKWTSNSFMNDDLLINVLNPFNCRELIETWLNVSRKERMNGAVHKKIIYNTWPELLQYKINPYDKYKVLQRNSLIYYLAVKAKYILGKIKFLVGSCD